jgi:hypothetical protein
LQVSGQLEGITGKLDEQHKDTLQILDIVNKNYYLSGIEEIEARFIAVMKGLNLITFKGTVSLDEYFNAYKIKSVLYLLYMHYVFIFILC